MYRYYIYHAVYVLYTRSSLFSHARTRFFNAHMPCAHAPHMCGYVYLESTTASAAARASAAVNTQKATAQRLPYLISVWCVRSPTHFDVLVAHSLLA